MGEAIVRPGPLSGKKKRAPQSPTVSTLPPSDSARSEEARPRRPHPLPSMTLGARVGLQEEKEGRSRGGFLPFGAHSRTGEAFKMAAALGEPLGSRVLKGEVIVS